MYLSIVASLLGILAFFGTALTASAETTDTQTNIKINTIIDINTPLSLGNTQNTDLLGQIHETLSSIEQEKLDQKFARWKTKQANLWQSLPKEQFTINASAYTAAADECGKSDGITSSGLKVTKHRTLACPANFPFGAKIRIEGMGDYTCEDRGGAIVGNHIDIYMPTKAEAFAFGRRLLTAEVIQ